MCENTFKLDEQSLCRAGAAPEPLKPARHSFEDRTSRKKMPVGSACRVVGRSVQARRTTVQARRANIGGLCKFAPRRFAQSGRRVARLFKVPHSANRPEKCCFGAREAQSSVLNFENEPLTLLFHSYDISNIFNGYFIF